jgi:hypothetical protein
MRAHTNAHEGSEHATVRRGTGGQRVSVAGVIRRAKMRFEFELHSRFSRGFGLARKGSEGRPARASSSRARAVHAF